MKIIVIIVALMCIVPGLDAKLSRASLLEIDRMLELNKPSPPFYHTGKQTDVYLSIFVTQVRFQASLDEADFTFYSYQIWNDPRMQFMNQTKNMSDYHVVRNEYFQNIWLVESYVENELHSRIHDSAIPNKFLWLFPNGTLAYSMRMTVGLFCDLVRRGFPSLHYTCRLKFRIHSYPEDKVNLKWGKTAPVRILSTLDSPKSDIEDWNYQKCAEDSSAVVQSSCLEIIVHINQNYAENIVRLYIPSVFVVIVGWLSFWVDRSEVSARVKLGTLCLLSMITEEVGIKFLMPNRERIPSVDVWFYVNLVFVVMAIVEFTVVHAIDSFRKRWKNQEKRLQNMKSLVDGSNQKLPKAKSPVTVENVHPDISTVKPSDIYCFDDEEKITYFPGMYIILGLSTGRIEKISRVSYAVAYVIFQIVYWSYYLSIDEILV